MTSPIQNMLNDDVEIMLQATKILEGLQHRIGLSHRLHPLWYRGLSEIQLNAVDTLGRALGDDILQGSMHRTYRKLAVLGVVPPPPKSGMRILLRMSRGNDVAFLWFLMEMFYKTCHHEINYQLNEQIIMTAIFWLDLFPTLNELDRWLPPPQKSVQLQYHKKHHKNGRGESQLKKQSQALALIQPEPVDLSLPYFQKHIWPKPWRQRVSAERPEKQIFLPTKPTIMGQSTFESRWFSAYRFNPSERVARDVLIKEIDNLLMKLSGTDHKAMNQQCTYGDDLTESMKFNLERIRRERLEYLTTGVTKSQERIREKVLDQLECLSDKYTLQLRAQQSAGHSLKTVHSGIIYPEDSDEEVICGLVDSKLGFHLSGNSPPPACRDHIPRNTTFTSQCFKVKNFDDPLPVRKSREQRHRRKGNALHVNTDTKKDPEQSKDSSQCQCSTDSDFFKLGPTGCLYNFNFAKIFRVPRDEPLKDESTRLKAEVLKAFGEDIDFQDKVLNNETNGSLDYLVDRFAKRLFRESSKLFDEKYEKNEKLFKNDPETEKLFKQENGTYDPDNIKLMRKMLRQGLDHLAEDRRFVLPNLPDVHCVPLLLEWIRARFGKRYNQEELQQQFFKDKILMEDVMSMMSKIILRTPKQSRTRNKNQSNSHIFAAYTVHRQKLTKMRDQHVKQFSILLMEMGRIFYAAMNAHLHTPSSGRFHAYLPTQIRDLHITHGS